MQLNKLYFKVFVGSPSDLDTEREFIKNKIKKLNDVFSLQQIFLDAFDYQDLSSKPVEPQSWINENIKLCDLVILLFGYTLGGGGTIDEYKLAQRLFDEKSVRNLMVYFKKIPKEKLIHPTNEILKVQLFKKKIESKILYHYFSNVRDLESQLTKHLIQWFDSQRDLINIFNDYKFRIDPLIIETLKVGELPYTDEIIDLNNENNTSKLLKFEKRAYDQYKANECNEIKLTDCYLIARYLLRAIKNDDSTICRYKPFNYQIHQYLSKIIRELKKEDRTTVEDNLIKWLNLKENVYEISRDFAAFELGMSKVGKADKYLLKSLADKNELFNVRFYSALALGMLMKDDYVMQLIEIYKSESNSEIRSSIAHSILFINNLINF